VFRRLARVEVRQDGRLLARSRRASLVPGRPVYLAAGWVSQVDPVGGPVRVALASGSLASGSLAPGDLAAGDLASGDPERGRMEA
jgi:hypothetical protein